MRIPYVVMSDICDNTKNCINNICNFYGGCVEGFLVNLYLKYNNSSKIKYLLKKFMFKFRKSFFIKLNNKK